MKKTIKYLVAGSVALCASAVILVSCGDDDKSLPKIDGYNNSNEVAEENLIAHWAFNGSDEEVISDTEASVSEGTVAYEDGQIGEALKLSQGALSYPVIDALSSTTALSNFTISMWVKVNNNKGTTLEAFSPLFGVYPETGGDWMWGNVNMLVET